jgi:hypothetical protein
MDLFAHACYGALLCSRSGLAGGRKGNSGRKWYRDGSLWLAVFFGLLPDIVSMWIPYLATAGWTDAGRFFRSYGGGWLEVYRWMHSLIPALLFCGLMGGFCRKLFVVSLAWPVHILCDAVSHGTGKFGTMIFFPASRFQFDGIPFWRHGWFMVAYWAVLAGLAIFIILWRKAGCGTPSPM